MSHAVAAGHRLTVQAAEDMLREGGTAVDACIAGACMAFVAEPVLAQPLGGGFMMLAPKSGRPQLLDAFVQTPSRKAPESALDLDTITVDFGTALQDFHIGAGTIASPCLIPALFEAHARHGRLPWRDLVAPAVSAARTGVEVTAFQAHVAELVAAILSASPELAALATLDGQALAPGTLYRNRDLADVLEVMAAEGPRFFTEGEIAQALAEIPGGQVSRADISAAQAAWRTPLLLSRGGTDIALNPPPSLGGVQIALALSILADNPDDVSVASALFEVVRQRKALGMDAEPDSAGRALDPQRLAELRRTLAEHRPSTRGTTHISVIAGDGSGAALSLSNGEGCGRLLPGTGIQPNNMLGEEDLVPGGPVAWAPDRRLSSMMAPTLLRDRNGDPTLLGTGGSNRIRSAITTTILALVDHRHRLEDAVAAPRLHVEGDKLDFEDLGDAARRDSLLSVWPDATRWDGQHMFFGGVHAVRRTRGAAEAAGDPRRAGAAATG